MGLAQFGSRGGRLRQRLGRPACDPHGRWIWARDTGTSGPARRRARLSGRSSDPAYNAEVMAAANWVEAAGPGGWGRAPAAGADQIRVWRPHFRRWSKGSGEGEADRRRCSTGFLAERENSEGRG